MATWTQLIGLLRIDLTDQAGIFHVTASVRTYLEQAELLLTLRRALYERTQTLPLTSSTPLYAIHAIFPDFIRPLRVTVGGVALRWDSLASVGRLKRKWYQERAEVESTFMVGATHLGFSPLPVEASADVTYLAIPPTTTSAPIAGTSPMLGEEWHRTMLKYGEAIALAKEGAMNRASVALKEFLALANIERDERFLENLAQKDAQQNTRTVERQAND